MTDAASDGRKFTRPLEVQARVVRAIVLREVKTRFGRDRLGYIWALLEPMLLVSVFIIIFSIRARTAPYGIPITLFMLAGFVPFLSFRNLYTRLMGSLNENRALLSFPQVTVIDIVYARFLLDFATGLCVFVVLATIAGVVMREPVNVEDPLALVFWLTVLGMLGFGIGGVLAALVPVFPSITHFVQPMLSRPLLFLSGLFFTAEMVPEPFRTYLLYNPILHIIEKIRSAFFHEFESTHAVTSYPLWWVLGLCFAAFLLNRALRNRILTAALTL